MHKLAIVVSFLSLSVLTLNAQNCIPTVVATGTIGEHQCPVGGPYEIDARQYKGTYPDGYTALITGSGHLTCAASGSCPNNVNTYTDCLPTFGVASGNGFFSVTTTSYTTSSSIVVCSLTNPPYQYTKVLCVEDPGNTGTLTSTHNCTGLCDCGSNEKCCTNWGCYPTDDTCPSSPIVLDTFNEGFHLTSLNNGIRFHLLPGGPLQQMSWTDANWHNGWLALDRNGDGTIDDFTELFGDLTAQPPSNNPNGFLALAVFDHPSNGGNGNGFIDPGDSVYSSLRVWIDANHNGFSEPSELHTLQELGVFKIGLKYNETPFVDQYGNRFRFKGSIWDQGGTEKDVCYDVFLQIQTN